jgi:hypothetical protein
MLFLIGACHRMTTLHVHHSLLHDLMEMGNVISFMILVFETPPKPMPNLVIVSDDPPKAMSAMTELMQEVEGELPDNGDRAFAISPPRAKLGQTQQGKQTSDTLDYMHFP